MSIKKPIVKRDIREVIKQIKEKVPVEMTKFHNQLDWVVNDAFYRPPEDQGVSWRHLTIFTHDAVGTPTTLWECEVASILSTRSLEQIKKEFNFIES